MAGAVVAAALATIPIVVLPSSVESDVVRWMLAGFTGSAGHAVGRKGGATRLRSVVYGASMLVVAAVVALVENLLAGH